jgi:uncharacterized membrane-anchored protein
LVRAECSPVEGSKGIGSVAIVLVESWLASISVFLLKDDYFGADIMKLQNPDAHADNLLQPIAPPLDFDPLVAPDPNRPRSQKLSIWRMALPLFLQSVLICSIPFQSVYALMTGTTVIIKTQPVDPFDLLRGYYQTLNYDISSFNTLEKLPGWKDVSDVRDGRDGYISNIDRHQPVYITLVKTTGIDRNQQQAWQPVAIDKNLPANLSADRIALRGVSDGHRILYGLETYYMPEERKDAVNTEIGRSRSAEQLLVEIKVDNRGLATPVSLWIGQKRYHF